MERAAVTDAIRFWEPARLAFNLILAVFVIVVVGLDPGLLGASWRFYDQLLIGAVLANVLYSSAYAVDLFVQASAYRAPWRRYGRMALWLVGTALACVLAAESGLLDERLPPPR